MVTIITVNGLDLEIVMAHYQYICLLTSALSVIANSDADGEGAIRNARKALELWDKHRTEKPAVNFQIVQVQEAQR